MLHLEHKPVLKDEVVKWARDLQCPEPILYMMDGTFGRGGHLRAIWDIYPHMKILALDQDDEAIQWGEEIFSQALQKKQIFFLHINFAQIEKWKTVAQNIHQGHGFDLILLDLGVSSPQLDAGGRGFSFYAEGPLDMRMDRRSSISAKDIINQWSAVDLAALFQEQGEIRNPRRVVEAIISARRDRLFESTRELALLIEKCVGWRKKGQHPATQYFLALRLQVNRELEVIEGVIPALIEELADQGRLMIITFHSLEDRIVKYALRRHLDQGYLVNKKVIQADRSEIKMNSRARSAKLRVFQKGKKGESKKWGKIQ